MSKRVAPSLAIVEEPKRVRLDEDNESEDHNSSEGEADFFAEPEQAPVSAADPLPSVQSSDNNGNRRVSRGFTNKVQSEDLPVEEDLDAYFPTHPDQRVLLRISDNWNNIQMRMPTELPFALFKPQDLAFETSYEHVVGMLSMRDILENSILPAMQRPQEYEFNGNRAGHPIQQAFFFYGKHGSGIRTLVRSFCRTVGANLIVATHPGFDARINLKELYELAAQNQPCIVLMIDTDVQFGANSPNVTLLANILEEQRLAGVGVWTIFRSEQRPGFLAPQIQEMIDYSVWAELPNSLQRIQLWALALSRYMPKLPHRQELNKLASKSEYCTARNIFRSVRSSASKKAARLNKEHLVLSDAQRAFKYDDIEEHKIPGVGSRMTLFDPGVVNASPYQDYIPSSGDMQPPRRR